jgi:hypothetical protein
MCSWLGLVCTAQMLNVATCGMKEVYKEQKFCIIYYEFATLVVLSADK